MTTKRDFLKLGAAAALFAPFAGLTSRPALAQSDGIFRFGVVADPQYAPVAPNLKLNRYYSNSLWKLSEAIDALNREDLRFVVTMGDIIDRYWESYAHILPLYDKLKHDRLFMLGNHDYEVAAEYLGSILRTVGMSKAYYDFVGGGYRFVVLDGNDVSLFAPPPDDPRRELAQSRLSALKAKGAINAAPWNGSLSDEQFAWLEQTLKKAKAAGEKAIVLGHYPIYPAHELNMWDSERIVELLTASDGFVAYLGGHNHDGNFGTIDRRYFVTFKGMVDTPTNNAYSVVEIHNERIEIRGFGRESSRSLEIKAG